MRGRIITGLATGLTLAGCQSGQPAAAPSVTEARVTLPAAPGLPAAGYFVLSGGGGDALVGVSSPAAERIEMHESATDGRGVTAMRPLAEVPLGGGEVVFAPGGKHLMVHGLDPQARPGTPVALVFRFRTAAPLTVPAPLVPPGSGDAPPAGH